jgi:membrane associated rhomboid family serine protease
MIPLKDDTPARAFPFLTLSLIGLNAALYIYGLILGPQKSEFFIMRTAVIPYEITGFVDIEPENIVTPPFTLLSAMFVHGGAFHLLGNMLYLWIFGDNIEDRLGRMQFIVFYISTGVVASLSHIALNPSSTVPMIGASGAVAGIMGAYFVFYPRSKVITLVYFVFYLQLIRIPAVVFLGLWFLTQLLYGATVGGGIAWYAHVGGFAAGAATGLVIKTAGRKRWV